MIERLRGAVHLASRLRVAREAVYEGRFLPVHVCSDHRYLSFSLALDFLDVEPGSFYPARLEKQHARTISTELLNRRRKSYRVS